MMKNCKEDFLENLCELITDGSHFSPPSQEEGYYMASVKDMGDYNFDFSDCRKISKEDYEKLFKSNCSPKNNDILIAKDGSPLSNIFVYTEEFPMVILSSIAIIRADSSKILPKFLKYYLENKAIKHYIQSSYTSGSVIPRIILKDFKKFSIQYPSIENQIKIISVLESLDKKIELNKKINQNLENTLRLLYNSWFEKFECYDKTNGMIEDFEFGSIPKNWNAEMLYDYVNFVTGVEPGSKNYHETFEEGLIPFIRVGDLSSRDNMIFIDENLSKNKIIVPEDIVLSLDATVGIVKIGLSGSYSTGIRKLVIKNNKINKSFLFCLIKSNRIQRIINLYATGTTILHASKSVKHINFILPEKEFMNKFNLIGQPILSKLLNNLEEISKLTKLRDILLPKLMSGEIDVSNVEI